MDLSRRQIGPVQVLSFPAPLELEGEESAAFRDQIRRFVGAGVVEIVMDLGNVGFIDSSGLGALVSVLKTVRQEGDLKLAAVSESVRTVLEITRLLRIFELHPDSESAVRSFAGEPEAVRQGARERP